MWTSVLLILKLIVISFDCYLVHRGRSCTACIENILIQGSERQIAFVASRLFMNYVCVSHTSFSNFNICCSVCLLLELLHSCCLCLLTLSLLHVMYILFYVDFIANLCLLSSLWFTVIPYILLKISTSVLRSQSIILRLYKIELYQSQYSLGTICSAELHRLCNKTQELLQAFYRLLGTENLGRKVGM